MGFDNLDHQQRIKGTAMRLIRMLKNDLAKESQSWVEKDIISESQAQAICALYGADYHDQGRHSRAYLILTILGYLFLGLAVILLLSHNWEEIPRALRMSGLVLATASAHVACVWKYRAGQQGAAVGFGFLACLLYGASIMLIAQIYHLGEHFPDGIYWWAMGCLPFALVLRSHVIHLLTMAIALTWFYVESSLSFFPVTFVIFLAALGWHLLRERQSVFLFLLWIFALVNWLEYSLAWLMGETYRFDPNMENVLLAAGLTLVFKGLAHYLCIMKHPKWIDYGTSLKLWTMRLTLVSLFVFGFEEPWREMIWEQWHSPSLAYGIAIACTGLALFFSRKSPAALVSTAISAGLLLGVLTALLNLHNRDYAVAFQALTNLATIGWGLWLIISGINDRVGQYFYTGLVALLGTALLRYIDLVGDYIGASLLFGFFALVLLVVSRRWYQSQLKAQGAHHD